LSIKDTYKTLVARSEGIYREKGSKFIGIAVPCYSEEEAKTYLLAWKKEHHQARHLCYAYRFGLDKKIYRANDDGEPSNSAGIPILGQIQSFDLSNVLIGVVRYYGGTKLGVGGLVNAYKTAAKEALEVGVFEEKQVFHHLQLTFSYEQMPEMMHWLKKSGLTISNQNFVESCSVDIALPLDEKDRYKEELGVFSCEQHELGEY
jgi:uncharacterized YigZ family protein